MLDGAINDFTGGITIDDGVLVIGNSGSAGSGNIIINHGALAVAGYEVSDVLAKSALIGAPADVTIAARVTPAGGDIWVPYADGKLTLTGTLRGSGDLRKTGAGKLTISANRGGISPFSGNALVFAGVLETTVSTPLATTSIVSIAKDAAFYVTPSGLTAATTFQIGALSDLEGQGGGTVAVGANGYSVSLELSASDDATFSGIIRDNTTDGVADTDKSLLNIVKRGDYTQTFAGEYKSLGLLTIYNGIWKLDGTNALGGSNGAGVTVIGDTAQSGTLDINGGSYGLIAAEAYTLNAIGEIVTDNDGNRLHYTVNKLSKKTARISGEGYNYGGAITDSKGDGVFPSIVLQGNATVTTAGTSTLSNASGYYTLTLEPTLNSTTGATFHVPAAVDDVLLNESTDPNTADGIGFVSGQNRIAVSKINIGASTSLVLEGLERLTGTDNLATSSSLNFLDADSTLYLAGAPATVTQTLGTITGTDIAGTEHGGGVIDGFGLVKYRGANRNDDGTFIGTKGTLDVRLAGEVNFEITAGALQLRNTTSTTRGTITIASGAALVVSERLQSNNLLEYSLTNNNWLTNSDPFGAAVIELASGTLEFRVNDGPAATSNFSHDVLFSGTSATFNSSGTSPVNIAGGRVYFSQTAGITSNSYAVYLSGTSTAENSFALLLTNPEYSPAIPLKLIKSGTGTWTINQGTNRNGAERPNSFTGGVEIAMGILRLGDDDVLPNYAEIAFGTPSASNAGWLDLNGHSQTLSGIYAKSGTPNPGGIANTSATQGTFIWNVAENYAAPDGTASAYLGGVINGKAANNFAFVKDGPGTLTLQGSVLYTGPTTVRAGTLRVTSTSASPKSKEIFVNPNATFDFSALSTGWQLASGYSITAGSAPTTDADGNDVFNNDLIGDLTLNGGSLTLGGGSSTGIQNTWVTTLAGSLSVTARSALNIQLGTYANVAGDPTTLLRVEDTILMNAGINLGISFANGYVTPGDFPFLQYTSELQGVLGQTIAALGNGAAVPVSAFTTATSSDPSYVYSVVKLADKQQLAVRVVASAAGAGTIYWVGSAVPGDPETGYAPESVWGTAANFSTGGYTDRTSYKPGAQAFFNDEAQGFDVFLLSSASGGGDVIIGSAGVWFDNSEHNYTISGNGGAIDGVGFIRKTGSAVLKINTANKYHALDADVASTILEAGTLSLGNDLALGQDKLLIYGGILTRNNDADAGATRKIKNAIEFVAGASATLDSGDNLVNGTAVTFELAGKLIAPAGVSITKAGTGKVFLSGGGVNDPNFATAFNEFNATITAAEGILGLQDTGDFSKAAFVVSATGTLSISGLTGLSNTTTKLGSLAGATGAVVTTETLGDKTIEVGSLLTDADDTATYAGSFYAPTGSRLLLAKVGKGTLVLQGDSSGIHGNTDVYEGALLFAIAADGSMTPPSGPIFVHRSSTGGDNEALRPRLIFDVPAFYGSVDDEGNDVAPLTLSQFITVEGSIAGEDGDPRKGGLFEKRGTGSLLISTRNDAMAGVTQITEGTLILGGEDGSAGTSDIVNYGTLVLDHGDNPFEFTNNLSGTGSLVKRGAGSATWLGTSSATGTTRVEEGEFHFGDGITFFSDQRHDAPIVLGTDSSFVRVFFDTAAAGNVAGTITVGNVTGNGQLIKTGDGDARLTGLVSVHKDPATEGADIEVREGGLYVGDGEGKHTRAAITVDSSISVAGNARLVVARTGSVSLSEKITIASAGTFDARGDNNGDGHIVLKSALNEIAGSMILRRNVAVEIAQGGRLNDGSAEQALTITFDPNSTLRFTADGGTADAPLQTGANLTFVSAKNAAEGGGVIEQAGRGVLVFNSDVAGSGDNIFEGTLRATRGTFKVAVADLPASVGLDARDSGVLWLSATGTALDASATFNVVADSPLDAAAQARGAVGLDALATSDIRSVSFGTGTGTVRLAPDSANAPVSFRLASGSEFLNGTVSIAAGSTLKLTAPSSPAVAAASVTGAPVAVAAGATGTPNLSAAVLRIEDGGALTGSGIFAGSLQVREGGYLAPANNSTITVRGDIVTGGGIYIGVAGTNESEIAQIHFTGATVISETSSLRLFMRQAVYDNAAVDRAQWEFLLDDEPSESGVPSVTGNFSQDRVEIQIVNESGDPVGDVITGQAVTYGNGAGGLTLRIGEYGEFVIGAHEDLNPLLAYRRSIRAGTDGNLKDILGWLEGKEFSNEAGGVDNSGRNFNGGSPLGFAALPAMPIGISQNAIATLRTHMESLRYGNAVRGQTTNFQPYFTATGIFENNRETLGGQAFGYRSYGGSVGADYNVASNFAAGVNAGYAHADATLEFGAGKVKHDNERIAVYATYLFNAHFYVDATLHAGLGQYNIRHTSVAGTARAKPEGYNFGGSVYAGSAFSFNRLVSITPFIGVEYNTVHVDGFTETGHDAAWRLDATSQDSLRARIGTGLNWYVPSYTDAFVLRIGLEAAIAHELLDADTELTARFAADRSGNSFTISTPCVDETRAQFGPTIDLEFAENFTFEFSWRIEYDFRKFQFKNLDHSLNAGFRLRF